MTALPYLPLILTPLLFVLVAGVARRLAPNARGSGIPQVIAASKQVRQSSGQSLLDLLTAGLKLRLTIAMLFGGASVGREGPTVQVSAALMVGIHRLLRVPITAGVLIAGGAAGVAAAYNTPLAVGAGVGKPANRASFRCAQRADYPACNGRVFRRCRSRAFDGRDHPE